MPGVIDRTAYAAEDIVGIHFFEPGVVKWPGEFPQIMHNVNSGKGHNIMVGPTIFNDMTTSEVEFGFLSLDGFQFRDQCITK